MNKTSGDRAASLTDAIILAGSRPGGDAMADSRGIAVKALIPVAGKAMLARVVQTILGHQAIDKLHLLAQDYKPFWDHFDTRFLQDEARVQTHKSAATIATSINDVLSRDDARFPVLITTADNVLLNESMIGEFLDAAGSSDIAIAVVEKQVLLGSYPASQRTWLTLRGGQYSGANLFYFGSPQARQILRYWAEVEQDRKKGWKILTIFGPWLLFLAVARMLTVDQIAARVGKKLGLSIKIVSLSQAEACIDVDKETDLVMVEKILAARG